jgi:hypothetical protein
MDFFDELAAITPEAEEELCRVVQVMWVEDIDPFEALDAMENPLVLSSEERIRMRAYLLWERFGRRVGDAQEFWLWAEKAGAFWDPEAKVTGWWPEGIDMARCGEDWAKKVVKKVEGVREHEIEGKSIDLWKRFLREMKGLVCEPPDPKYKDLLKRLNLTPAKSQLALTSTVASSLAVPLGIPTATMLAPFVAIGFLVIARFGRTELCHSMGRYLSVEGEGRYHRYVNFGLSIMEVKSDIASKKRKRETTKPTVP